MNISIGLIIRILIGGLLGGAIGIERELRSKGAGFRTHFLVALGSALLTVVSAYGFASILDIYPDARFDPSRVAAQIVSGIGFIGAGIIIFQKNAVHGLTTAAGLWATSAIGISCGAGLYDLAVVSTVLVLLALEATYITLGKRQMTLCVKSSDKKEVEDLIGKLKAEKVKISSCEIESKNDGDGLSHKATLEIVVKYDGGADKVLSLTENMDATLTYTI